MDAGTSPHGDLALTALFSEVAAGRRALWIGDENSAGAERLGEVALDLRVIDTSGRSGRNVPFGREPLALEGSFDVAVIPDGLVFDDAARRLGELRAALGDGVLIVGVSELNERTEVLRLALREGFREVRELGQAPFVAAAFADLTAPPTQVAVDGSLRGDDAVERYVFVAADELPDLESLVLVQLPAEAPAAEAGDALIAALRDELSRGTSRLEQAQVRLVETEAELTEARARLAANGIEGGAPANEPESVSVELASAELASVELASAELASVELASADASTELSEATIGLPVQPEGQNGEPDGSIRKREVRVLEGKLAECARALREAEVEVVRRGILVRDLGEELREWMAGRRGAPERRALSAGGGALDAEAALAAAEFTIDELRAELADAKETSSPSAANAAAADAERVIAQLRAELAAAKEAPPAVAAKPASSVAQEPASSENEALAGEVA
ncbi:MAG: hypothetical protein AAF645_21320, partial [Myxococcota bacterium]